MAGTDSDCFPFVRNYNDRTENAVIWAQTQKGFSHRFPRELCVLPKNDMANIKMTKTLISFALVFLAAPCPASVLLFFTIGQTVHTGDPVSGLVFKEV